MTDLSINDCLAYFKERGVWLSVVVDEYGEITAHLRTPPREKDAGQSTILTPPSVDGTDLLLVLNETVERLKETKICHQ